jgi:DNA-binding NtrC family response regulator
VGAFEYLLGGPVPPSYLERRHGVHILILDTPSGELRELADAFCAAEGEPSSVEVARTVAEGIARIRRADGPDLVVVDYLLGDGSVRGADVIAAIRAADGGIPIAATAERGDVSLAAEVVRSGAVDLLVRGADLERRVATLLSKVRNLLELRERNALLDEQNRLLSAGLARAEGPGASRFARALVEEGRRPGYRLALPSSGTRRATASGPRA